MHTTFFTLHLEKNQAMLWNRQTALFLRCFIIKMNLGTFSRPKNMFSPFAWKKIFFSFMHFSFMIFERVCLQLFLFYNLLENEDSN